MTPEIIYEDENVVALNKPAGLLVHGDGHNQGETLVDWLLVNVPEVVAVGDKPEQRPGIVHRLDKDTSGIMLIARNQQYFLYLKSLFQKRLIQKTYLALVQGVPKEEVGAIDLAISLKPGTTKRTVHGGKLTKPALTQYRLLKDFGEASLLEVSPKTGRTHQIRVHLAAIGCPVLGDVMYGPKKKTVEATRLMLHAESLEFELSPGRSIKLQADPPEDFKNLLAELEK